MKTSPTNDAPMTNRDAETLYGIGEHALGQSAHPATTEPFVHDKRIDEKPPTNTRH